jgi:hypothetical protein
MNLTRSAIHVSTVYIVASFGSILGGYLSGWLIKRGIVVYKARKYSMLFFAFCVVPIFFVRYTSSIWPAVWLISLAASAHQAGVLQYSPWRLIFSKTNFEFSLASAECRFRRRYSSRF